MKLISHAFKYDGEDSRHEIFFLGDIHLGAKLCHKKRLMHDLREVQQGDPETTHLVLMGDLGDYINRADKRFDEEEIDPEVINLYSGADPNEQTLDSLTDLLTPVKPYIRCILRGNHDQQNKVTNLWERYDRKLAERHYLNLPHLYGGYSAFVRWQFEHRSGGRKRAVVSHVHHGWQGGRTKGAKVNGLEKEISQYPGCDIIMRGHSHDLFVVPFDGLVPNQRFDDLKASRTLVGHTGTYLRTASIDTEGYAERSGYRAAAIGCIRVTVEVTEDGFSLEGSVRC